MTKWTHRFFKLARLVATWSNDPKCKVGCVLISPDRRQFSVGYNGVPAGMPNTEESLSALSNKNEFMIHAELNALLNASQSVRGWTAYVTKPPCHECAKALIQAGIAHVVFSSGNPQSKWQRSTEFALSLLHSHKVEVTIMEKDNE